MRRRTVLSIVGGGTLSLAGCVGAPGGDASGDTTPLPSECPKTQGFDLEWPDELDASAAEAFVQTYENRYYREVVLNYDPASSLASYQLDTWIENGATSTGGGYELAVSGGGGVYRPTLYLTARTASAPDGAEVVPAGEFDDEALNTTLMEAVETGEAALHVDEPGSEAVVRYLDQFESASEAFGPLTEPGDSDTLYVDVDGTTVELVVEATRFHGDYGWAARYYVDEHVVRRTTTEGTDPQDGELLECRTSTSATR